MYSNNEDLKKIDFLKNCDFLNIREIYLICKGIYASLLYLQDILFINGKIIINFVESVDLKLKLMITVDLSICTNINCKKKIFPIVYPTVIVNIIHKNKILLARNKGWKKNLYSCLAGFCEQNESAEDAARREVYEEVGLDLKKIKYKYSQYWPFTSNLMLGFEARKPKK